MYKIIMTRISIEHPNVMTTSFHDCKDDKELEHFYKIHKDKSSVGTSSTIDGKECWTETGYANGDIITISQIKL